MIGSVTCSYSFVNGPFTAQQYLDPLLQLCPSLKINCLTSTSLDNLCASHEPNYGLI